MVSLYKDLGMFTQGGDFFHHTYTDTKEEQISYMNKLINDDLDDGKGEKTGWHLKQYYKAN